MSIPGPPPKDSKRRQRRNKETADHEHVDVAARTDAGELAIAFDAVPKLPGRSKMLQLTRDAWDAFWECDLATKVMPSDLSALIRLFHLRDQSERALREISGTREIRTIVALEERLEVDENGDVVHSFDPVREVERMPGHLSLGSKGQLALHPSATWLEKTSKEIRALEDRFGLTPMARFRLGWQFAEMGNSLAAMNEKIAAAAAAQDDPRKAG